MAFNDPARASFMTIKPEFTDFEAQYAKGLHQCLSSKVIADQETLISLTQKLCVNDENSFVLESVTGGEIRGRYSVIGMKPDVIWRCIGDHSEINRNLLTEPSGFQRSDDAPLAALAALIKESQMEIPEHLPPMAAGLFGYLGYDMIRHVERLPAPNPDPIGMADAVMIRPSVIVVIDGVKGELYVISPVWFDKNQGDARIAYDQACRRIEEARALMDAPFEKTIVESDEDLPIQTPKSNMSKQAFFDMVEKAKEYIRAGDIFQVVPSQRWVMPFDLPPFSFYRALRRTNPSPYMFYFNFGDAQIIGASPEILVKTEGRRVTIRPIAGTRPRGKNKAEDEALEAELLSDPKELAEHLMLLDLGRNDVGRVSEIGSVVPTERFTVERYSHVMHIVSNVIGTLSEGEDALSALLAGLPAGTVSGAPKIRAMEIIDELEPEKRGVYSGGVGYFSANGDMDICIALRTAVLKDRNLYIQAGGGVVYDSIPENEYQETLNKSSALRRAAADAALFK